MIRFERLSYSYPGANDQALADVDAEVPRGATVLVAGPSGSGKSTLLRAVNGLVPHFSGGRLSGAVRVAGMDPVAAGPELMSGVVGFVSGDPEVGCVVDAVADDVAFALEERGADPDDIRRRVRAALERLGLLGLAHRPLSTLSGGERQRTAIASALALAPEVLVLDEPTSQLDDTAAAEVLNALADLARGGTRTILLSEHRRERIERHATHRLDFAAPGVPPLFAEGRGSAAGPGLADRPPAPAVAATTAGGEAARTQRGAAASGFVALEAVSFGFRDEPLLDGADLDLCLGEVVALTGPSGSGKTTLLRLVVGLIQPTAGHVVVGGRPIAGRPVGDVCRDVGYLPQDPGALLFADTVRHEVLLTLANRGIDPVGGHDPDELLRALGIEALADSYPRDLSTGQRQRAALAAVAAGRPRALLLDEPTRGLDDVAIASLAALLHRLAADGCAVLVATHDRRLHSTCDRVVCLRKGRIEQAL